PSGPPAPHAAAVLAARGALDDSARRLRRGRRGRLLRLRGRVVRRRRVLARRVARRVLGGLLRRLLRRLLGRRPVTAGTRACAGVGVLARRLAGVVAGALAGLLVLGGLGRRRRLLGPVAAPLVTGVVQRQRDTRRDRDHREHGQDPQLAAPAAPVAVALEAAVVPAAVSGGQDRLRDRGGARGVGVLHHGRAGEAARRGAAAVVHVDRAGVPGAGVAALVVEHLQRVLDQPAHLLGGLEAVVRLLGERAHHQPVQLRRGDVGGLGRRRGDVLDVLVHHRQRRLTRE